MTISQQLIADNWINDQLDLYRYAVHIGDAEWQHAIVDRLNDRDNLIRKELEHFLKLELWERFDDINRKVLAIYGEIRASKNARDHLSLLEKAWELKLERVQVGHKIKELFTNCGEIGELK